MAVDGRAAWALWAAAGVGACLGALRAPDVEPRKWSSLPEAPPSVRMDIRGRKVVIGMKEGFLSESINTSSPWQRFAGRDGYVLDAFQQFTGCFPVGVPPSGCNFDNSSCTNLLDLANGTIDITFSSDFVDPTDLPIEYAPIFHFGYMSVVVPRASRIPALKALVLSVEVMVWLSLVAVVAAAAGAWWAADHHPYESTFDAAIRAIVQVSGFVAAVPRSNVPRLCNSSIRLLIGVCSAFSIAFGCLFQGVLVENMTSPPFDHQINSLEELDASGMSIITPSDGYARGFRGSDSDLLNRLDSKQIVVEMDDNEIVPLFSRVSRKKDVGVLATKIWMKVYGRLSEDGPDSFHELHEYPAMYFVTYPIKKGSPYNELIADVTMRLTEAGMMTFWYKVGVANVLKNFEVSPQPPIVSQTVELPDLAPVLWTLLASHGLAVIICVGEILLLKRRKRWQTSAVVTLNSKWAHPWITER